MRQKLILACQEGQAGAVRELLKQGASVNWTDREGWPLLALAAAGGHDEVIRLLLAGDGLAESSDPEQAERVSVNAEGPGSWTALMQAAGHGHATTVQLLIEHRADGRQENVCGKSAQDIAMARGHEDVARVLERAGAGDRHSRVLIQAVRLLDPETFSVILSAFQDVDMPDGARRTALTHAAQLGRLEHMVQLLDRGADVNRRDPWGFSALDAALRGAALRRVDRPTVLGKKSRDQHWMTFQPQEAPTPNLLQVVELLLRRSALVNLGDDKDHVIRRIAEQVDDEQVRARIIEMVMNADRTNTSD